MSVRILRSPEEVEKIRGFWTSCPGQRDSDIDVFLNVIQGDPAIQRPHVLVFEWNGQPTALMAGWIVRRRLTFKVGYFKIFNPVASVMIFPYGSLRGDSSSEVSAQFIHTIVDSLNAGEADLARLDYMDTASNLYSRAKHVPGILTRDHFAASRFHRKRMLPASVDKLYASFSAHERKRFRQIQRKLNTDFSGQVKIDRLLGAEDLDRSLTAVKEISKKTWQEKIGTGLNIIGPLRTLFELQAEKSWLRLYTLYLSDKPCAFWIGTLYQGTFYSDFVGFDPEYAHYSPGMYLLCQIMEELASEGADSIDFGFSDEEYKRRFGNTAWEEASLRIFAPSSKGFALNVMGAVTYLLHEPARLLLTRTKAIDRLKKILRRK